MLNPIARLLAGLGLCLVCPAAIAAEIPRITDGALAVELSDVAPIPASARTGPVARINYLFHAGDGSGRLFIGDMRGAIYVIRNGVLLREPFLDVGAARSRYFFAGNGFERGLITFAFHPDFAKRGAPGFGKFYTLHTEKGGSTPGDAVPLLRSGLSISDHEKVLSEWSVDAANPDRIDPKSRREILRIESPGTDHGGGQIGFDPNLMAGRDAEYGLLYISVGDGGSGARGYSGVDPFRKVQDMTSPLGKMLRIDPLASGMRSYAVPKSNPFVNRAGVLPEIWASGLRNPERFSWDTGGAKCMLIADIGQAHAEEIDIGRAGANFGWSLYEGTAEVDHADQRASLPLTGKLPEGFAFPAAQYGHEDGTAITGGFVYRGKTMLELTGKYVFGDIVSGDLFYADAAALEAGNNPPIFRLRVFYRGAPIRLADISNPRGRADLRLGMGEDGELYALTKSDGMIRKLVRHTN